MLVNPSVPINSIPELIAYAKAHPAEISYASVGIGTANHMSGELFKMMAGVTMQHVPYRGGALALTDVLSGQVQLMLGALPRERSTSRPAGCVPSRLLPPSVWKRCRTSQA